MRRLPPLPAELPTASKVGLAMRCVYPWTSARKWGLRREAADAKVGIVVHGVAESLIRDDLETWGNGVLEAGLDEEQRRTATDLADAVTDFICEERERPHH